MGTISDGVAAERMKLVPAADANRGARVRAVQEVKGDLKLNADGRQVTRLPFTAHGLMTFDQRVLQVGPEVRRDVRHYREANAEISVGGASETSALSMDRRTVVVDCDGQRTTVYSPLGPLTRDQLELIEIQGNPTLLDRLLPTGEVAVGDQWKHDDGLVAQLLGLDAVHRNELSSTLWAVEKEIVVIDLSGNLRGVIGGVSSDIEVKAKYHFDRERRVIRCMAMTIKENRAIGHASPGFDVTARIRISIDPAEIADQLRDTALANLDLEAEPGSLMLEFTSHLGGFQFLHPRSWRVMVDRHDVAVLRMIDRGDLIAQCNASKLPDLPAGKRVSLEAFQNDIKRALSQEFGEIVQATQGTSGDGRRILRVVIAGLASELPIQWRYYHISNSAGRQVSFVFTMDAKLFERFAESDQGVISSFEFVDPTTAPTSAPRLGPAREASAAPAPGNELR
ncbi:MAG TPA: hypothetical protein QF564_26845 [Pirellulaceae bacterium]|nr:hypothetical protein [Pirellulaceae bacterium]